MFLIDTNICIYLIKQKSNKLLKKIEKEKLFNILISAVSVAELEYGVAKSLYPDKNRIALIEFLASFEIISYTDLDAEPFGQIRAYFESKGTIIGAYDLMIASQCLSRGLTLITNKIKEFERVPGLEIENWV